MTTKEKAELMLSYQPGQEWEYQCLTTSRPFNWNPCKDEPEWNFGSYIYRRKPAPPQRKLRAWRPEEVPVGALMRSLYQEEFIIMGRKGEWEGSVYISAISKVRGGWQSFSTEGCEYSLDHGKTWQPCGILE